VDRLPKRPLMITCDLVAAVALVSIPVAAWLDALTFQHLVVAVLICGTAAVCCNTAYHAYIRNVLDGLDLLEGNAKPQGSEAATRLAGPGLAGLLALPAAIGVGPFGAERSLNAAGAEEGLDEATASLVRFARTARGAALLAALIVASLPPVLLQPWVALLLIAGLFMLITLLLNRISGALPRLTLPAALHWCWWRALPLAVVGLVYLIIVS